MVGPVATTITELTADGMLTWTNAPTNATFTVQTAVDSLVAANWFHWIDVPVTNGVTVHRILDPNPPGGMEYAPAGSFVMGNTHGDGTSPKTSVLREVR